MDTRAARRLQLERQVTHWDVASLALTDPTDFAPSAAWQALERYLGRAVSSSLEASTARLRREVEGCARQLRGAGTDAELDAVARRVQDVRRMYARVETTVAFYGQAVNTRTSPKLAGHMRALDRVAELSMAAALDPLGRETPPVLTYIGEGLGAQILKAGIRHWDGSLSPAAAIKVTRHNLYRPTSLVHETGHQVAHILGWNPEVAGLIERGLAHAPALGGLWASWVSEITADAFAFAHCGYPAVAALHDVLANDVDNVLRIIPGDPHPVAYLRVLLGVQMCRRSYGSGPWDELASAWLRTYPLTGAAAATKLVVAASMPQLDLLVDVLLHRTMRCFGGRPLAALIDPGRVSPATLQWLATSAGSSLYTSPHWAHTEALRIVALTGLGMAVDPARTSEYARRLATFAATLSTVTAARSAA